MTPNPILTNTPPPPSLLPPRHTLWHTPPKTPLPTPPNPPRVAIDDVEVDDVNVTIKKGQGVIALNQSANRDDTVFPCGFEGGRLVLSTLD